MTTQATLLSKDGTTIAYETAGSGPAVLVISTVAEDRTGVAGIAALLSNHFTVVNFDRRGRGGSGDPQPYDPAREIEDIAALIDTVGGTAALVSGSGGCVLALDAATGLDAKVTGLCLYEPPFIVSHARPPVPADYVAHQEALVAGGKRSEAVEYFMTEALMVPAEVVEGMKQDPMWDQMAALAHTYAYDGRIVQGTPGREATAPRPLVDPGPDPRPGRREQRVVLRRGRPGARRDPARCDRRDPARPGPRRVLDGTRRRRRLLPRLPDAVTPPTIRRSAAGQVDGVVDETGLSLEAEGGRLDVEVVEDPGRRERQRRVRRIQLCEAGSLLRRRLGCGDEDDRLVAFEAVPQEGFGAAVGLAAVEAPIALEHGQNGRSHVRSHAFDANCR